MGKKLWFMHKREITMNPKHEDFSQAKPLLGLEPVSDQHSIDIFLICLDGHQKSFNPSLITLDITTPSGETEYSQRFDCLRLGEYLAKWTPTEIGKHIINVNYDKVTPRFTTTKVSMVITIEHSTITYSLFVLCFSFNTLLL